jgi:hypothetical protein
MTGARNIATRNGRHVGMNAVRTLGLQASTIVGVPVKLVRLIRMCLNESYIAGRIGERICEQFPIKSSLNKGDALL